MIRPTGRATLLLSLLLAGGCSLPASEEHRGDPADPVAPSAGAREPLPDLGPGRHELEVDGEAAVVVLPESPNGRLVVYAHGYEADAAAVLNDAAFGELAEGLVADGSAVAASDAGGNSWGNPASVDAHAALAATVSDLVDPTGVFLVAESMGGLAAAALVDGGRIENLRAYVGIYPLCDLRSVRDGFAESIEAAYGDGLDEALDRLSPVALDAAVPALFWASEEDTVVDKGRNADVCAAQVVAAGGRAAVVATEGEHGDPSNFDLGAMLAFFDSAAT